MRYFYNFFVKTFILLIITLAVSCGSDDDSSTTGTGTGTGTPINTTANISEGSWSGTWDNTTFGSDGPLTISVTDNNDDTLTVVIDLDGFVGGIVNPDPQTVTATVDVNGDASFSGMVDMNGSQGQLDFTLSSAGALSVSLPSIPVSGFDSFTATGTLTTTTGTVTYTVNFTGGGSAMGTASATKS